MDKEQRLAERAQECGARRVIAGDGLPADKTRELNAREEDLDGRDEALKRSEGLLEARRAQELAEARKEAEKLREEARAEANDNRTS